MHPRDGRRIPLRVADALADTNVGITLLALLLVYCWIGSAGLAPFRDWFVRQAFEKTEMEWFTWWPFTALIALFSLSVLMATVRRIPFNREKLGVWTVHLGVVVLVTGCAVYFGLKQEGDMVLYRREAVITAGGGEPALLTLRPGAWTSVRGPSGGYTVRVSELNPAYTLLTGADQGKTAYSAQLSFEPHRDAPGARPFIRQLLVGYPEYTEDVLPGEGRAVKLLGKPLVDESVQVDLRYASSDRMYLRDRPALHARVPGAEAWTELPLRGLPHYAEHVAAGEPLWVDRGEEPPRPRALAIRPRPKGGENAGGLPADLTLRVAGFLPYAELEERWGPGGETLNPLARVALHVGGSHIEQDLLAFDPARNSIDEGVFQVRFLWTEDEAERAKWLAPAPARLRVTVKGAARPVEVPLGAAQAGEVAVPGTSYRLFCEQLFPHWQLAGAAHQGARASMALVRVTGPSGTFRRAVIWPDADLSQDLSDDGMGHGGSHGGLLDPGLRIELADVQGNGLTLVGGPDGLEAACVGHDGELWRERVRPGEPFRPFDGHLDVTVEALWERAAREMRPAVVPPMRRSRKAGEAYSLVKVELEQGEWKSSRWLEFSAYAHPSRMGYHPVTLPLPGGNRLELVYSLETRQLPAPVALETFQLETYPGQTRERDYISLVRFFENGRWSEPQKVHSNNPAEHAGWQYFQSTWDPPDAGSRYAGMNYTGLGIGNSRGTGLMILGSLLTVLGTLHAFYLKPVLARRRRAANGGLPAEGEAGGMAAHFPRHRARGARAPRRGREAQPAGKAGIAARAGISGLLLASALAAVPEVAGARDAGEPVVLSVSPAFAAALELEAIRLVAVQDEGRVKTFDSLAREKLKFVNSSRGARRSDPVLVYLDMMFAPDHYAQAPVVFIKKAAIRRDLAETVRAMAVADARQGPVSDAELDRMVKTGLVSLSFLDDPLVQGAMMELGRDLMRAGREMEALRAARTVADPRWLADAWRVVPPPGGTSLDPWHSLTEVEAGHAGHSHAAGMHEEAGGIAGLAADRSRALGRAFAELERAWVKQDAGRANEALAALARELPAVEPALYPAAGRLRWEHWYYRHHKLTATWIVYFLALPFLLLSVTHRLRWARRAGMTLFAAGFLLHTFALGLRWHLAGRIPVANMFEAVLASAWFGGLAALAMELGLRRRDLRAMPALAASTYAALAMMCGHFLPVELNSDISPVMPILDRTVWLYIHTNMIIASYALIFFSAVTATLYMAGWLAHAAAPAAGFARLWAGDFALAHAGGPRRARRSAPSNGGGTRGMEGGLGRSLDGATMIFLQLGFITLWVGTLLGAVWASVSWGRPWGWDPKEVFALNTWLVLLILVHVRFKVKDKALWTALLALAATAVMLFNWIAVNFVITGLHSYA